MDKHTPGPWKIDWYTCREGGKELWRVPRSIGPIYTDHNHWAGTYITGGEANARLIAAAPDLLDALRRVMRHIPADAGGCSLSDDMHRARAAIARATEE
jgi:hypothetical protein